MAENLSASSHFGTATKAGSSKEPGFRFGCFVFALNYTILLLHYIYIYVKLYNKYIYIYITIYNYIYIYVYISMYV